MEIWLLESSKRDMERVRRKRLKGRVENEKDYSKALV